MYLILKRLEAPESLGPVGRMGLEHVRGDSGREEWDVEEKEERKSESQGIMAR